MLEQLGNALRTSLAWLADASPWIYLPIFLAVWLMVAFTLKAIIFNRLRKITDGTETKLDSLLLNALDLPLKMLIVVSGVLAALSFTAASEKWGEMPYLANLLVVTSVAAGIIFADRLVRGTVTLYADKVPIFRTAGGLLQACLRGIVFTLGIMVLLTNLGVTITPLLASLGVGSLAIALALQPTLENFFSGVQLVVDKQIQQGQLIKLESGEEGFVERIGWRSTWIRLFANSMVVVPNKVLVTSRVLNHDYPTKECNVIIPVGVHYNMQLDRVEQITLEVAEEVVARTPGTIKTFKPVLRFSAFNASSIDFNVIMRADAFTSCSPLRHEFIKALHARYLKENITIPFPIMALNLEQEGAAAILRSAGPGVQKKPVDAVRPANA